MSRRQALSERFWSKVDRNGPTVRTELGPCWIWNGTCGSQGRYGKFRLGSAMVSAHRVAWLLATGAEPIGCVCHKCDVPRCVNPGHLFIGTQAENIQDACQKGRLHNPSGEKHPAAKLTASDVETIRRSYTPGISNRGKPGSPAMLALKFGVCTSTIRHIVDGRGWVST